MSIGHIDDKDIDSNVVDAFDIVSDVFAISNFNKNQIIFYGCKGDSEKQISSSAYAGVLDYDLVYDIYEIDSFESGAVDTLDKEDFATPNC
jgi:hypothetical protein